VGPDSPFDENTFVSIAYGGGKFVANDIRKIAYSTDVIAWNVVEDSAFGSDDDICAIAYGDGKFVVNGSRKVAYSNLQE
jgi:hypothetical protein